MAATGIVRRVDELGRVVIPKWWEHVTEEWLQGRYCYDICPACLHWSMRESTCALNLRSKRKPCGNVQSCPKYNDSHTVPKDHEIQMGEY